jgi:hypothetical protein
VLESVPGHRDVVKTAGLQSYRAVSDHICGVDGDLLVVVRPERGDAAHVQVGRRHSQDAGEVSVVGAVVLGRQWGVGEAVLTQDLGGYPLAQAIGVLRVGQQHGVRVGVGIDESWRDGQSGRCYDTPGIGPRQVADGVDLLASYAHVGGVAGLAGPIDDGPTCYHDIEHVVVCSFLSVLSRSRDLVLVTIARGNQEETMAGCPPPPASTGGALPPLDSPAPAPAPNQKWLTSSGLPRRRVICHTPRLASSIAGT